MNALGLVHELLPAERPDAPTLLLLHGTGGDERDLLPLGRTLAADAALLSPRGAVQEHGMARWFRRHAEGVFDSEDVVRRAADLARFVADACARYALDPSTVVAAGFSNGANIAAALLLLHPGVLRGAVLLAPMVPLEEHGPVDLSGVAAFLGAGRADPVAPPDQAERLAALLTDRGAAVELHWHPGGHGVDRGTVAAATTWLAKLRAAIAADPLP